MTIRNFLLKELEKRGVKVNTEVSYATPIGRLMPDMLIHNGAQYVVETKLGAEAKLLDAMVRLYDYSKHTQAKGAFAVLFPKELRQPWSIEILAKIARDPKLEYVATAIFKDLRPSQRFAGNLDQMADWMASQVLRPPVVEADTSFAIKVLTEAVTSISASVKRLRGQELEDIFGGRTVFENILQYEEGRYPLEEMRQAATYLLVNQIIFYHVLSRMDATFETIDEDKIGKPDDLLRYFRPVLERDYSSVFGFDVASRLPVSATDIVKRVIMTVKALAPEKIGHDVLGKVFHELIPFNIRKAVAAFYTNNEAAEILAQLAIETPDAKVLDLAVGSGTLLVAAYRRKRELLRTGRGGISLEDHKRFLEQDLTGVDIMPFAAHLAVMHLSLQALLHETEKVRVAVWDSTELKPGMIIPAIYNELKAAYRRPTLDMFEAGAITPKEAYIKKGAITLEGVGGEEIPLTKADLVIMNPPFTRQERLPREYKDALLKRFNEYENQLHGQLGLWGYFLLLADRFVKQGGRIALVYPSRPLGAQSAEQIRRFLLDNYSIEYIITSWKRAAFSESAQYREVLLVMRKVDVEKEDRESFCKIVNLKSLPRDLEEARSFAHEIKAVTSEYNSGRIRASILTQKELEDTVDNWFIHIASFDPAIAKKWVDIRARAAKRLLTFREYLKKRHMDITRGVETKGAFGFPFYEAFIVRNPERALKSYDLWFSEKIVNRNLVASNRLTGETTEIPRRKLCHGIRRASGMKTLNLSDTQDYIIVEDFDGLNRILPANSLKNFKKHSKAWKEYVKSRFGRFLISRRFNLSAKGTHLLAFYSDEPTTGQNLWSLKGADKDEARIFTLWFNSTPNLLQAYLRRVETEGAWMEINKGMIYDFLLFDPSSLNEKEKNQLQELFGEVENTEFPSITDQLRDRFEGRVKIDKAFLEIFGFDDGEIEEILDRLYPAFANEIEQLKRLMAG